MNPRLQKLRETALENEWMRSAVSDHVYTPKGTSKEIPYQQLSVTLDHQFALIFNFFSKNVNVLYQESFGENCPGGVASETWAMTTTLKRQKFLIDFMPTDIGFYLQWSGYYEQDDPVNWPVSAEF
jgi:hypothetical protein